MNKWFPAAQAASDTTVVFAGTEFDQAGSLAE